MVVQYRNYYCCRVAIFDQEIEYQIYNFTSCQYRYITKQRPSRHLKDTKPTLRTISYHDSHSFNNQKVEQLLEHFILLNVQTRGRYE
jgi:gamma-glutamylcysteine synthetase